MAQRGEQASGQEPPDVVRIIGANLYRLRMKTETEWRPRMTQREVAAKAGLNHNLVSQLEKSRYRNEPLANAPTVTTLSALARVFGVEPAELLRYDSSTAPYLSGPSANLRIVRGGGEGLVTGVR